MKTQLLKVDTEHIESSNIAQIARTLQEGKLVIYPTETFYGLGANCFSEKAVAKIYRLKQRDREKPLSVIVSGMDMVEEVTLERPDLFYSLSSRFWPGSLTIVLKASERFPEYITGRSGTIGIRWPDHRWLNALVEKSGFPITATSANLSGAKEISSPERALDVFNGKVDLLVDGGRTQGKLPSAVISLVSDKPRILRQGAISAEELKPFL
jgi:L-threonylcarbamoyladenylate synthase